MNEWSEANITQMPGSSHLDTVKVGTASRLANFGAFKFVWMLI